MREALNLLTCADSSTNTKVDNKDRKEREKKIMRMCHVSQVKCHISCVMCFAYHLPPVTNANRHSHRPFPY